MSKVTCPRCDVGLQRRFYRNVRQSGCPSCNGFAAEFISLLELVAKTELDELLTVAARGPRGDLGCPVCRAKMQTLVQKGEGREVQLDLCLACLMLWLDAHEWEMVGQLKGKEIAKAPLEFAASDHVAPWRMVVALFGMPVEEEPDLLEHKPWLTWGLMVACTVVFSWAFFTPKFAFAHLAHSSGLAFPWNVTTALSAFFLHASAIHLVFNMYFLWVFGDNVEDQMGHRRYLLLILAAIFSSTLLADWQDPRLAYLPAVGASGGISGVIGYYLARFPYRRFVLTILTRTFTFPAFYFGLAYALKEGVGVILQSHGMFLESHMAHLGGAVVGAAYAFFERSPFLRLNRARD